MLTCTSYAPVGTWTGPAWDLVVLRHNERQLQRQVLFLEHGDDILLDLPSPACFIHGDGLWLHEIGRFVEIVAMEEDLLEVLPRDAMHLSELCWHVGSRRLAAQIEAERILVLKDEASRRWLEGLGAAVHDVSEPFHPVAELPPVT